MSIYATFRMSDLGPFDDPRESAMDAIAEEPDFRAKFVAEHVDELIDLITTPSWWAPTIVAGTANRLNDAWGDAQRQELNNRRDV